jgi:predicted CoA-binding protein
MSFANPSDVEMAALLQSARVFAVVGASPKPDRPVYGVMQRLIAKGYTVVPVNPGQAGREILGQKVYATLADVPAPADIVDIFRASDAALDVVQEAIANKDRLGIKAVWMQIGVINDEAARLATKAGLTVVMDRCPKIELARLAITRG